MYPKPWTIEQYPGHVTWYIVAANAKPVAQCWDKAAAELILERL